MYFKFEIHVINITSYNLQPHLFHEVIAPLFQIDRPICSHHWPQKYRKQAVLYLRSLHIVPPILSKEMDLNMNSLLQNQEYLLLEK